MKGKEKESVLQLRMLAPSDAWSVGFNGDGMPVRKAGAIYRNPNPAITEQAPTDLRVDVLLFYCRLHHRRPVRPGSDKPPMTSSYFDVHVSITSRCGSP